MTVSPAPPGARDSKQPVAEPNAARRGESRSSIAIVRGNRRGATAVDLLFGV